MVRSVFVGVIVATFAVLVVAGAATLWRGLTSLPDTGADASAAGAQSIREDGSFLVGSDIAEGTYRSVDTEGQCRWVLYSGGVAVGKGEGDEPWTVTISERHSLFRTSRCGSWERVEE